MRQNITLLLSTAKRGDLFILRNGTEAMFLRHAREMPLVWAVIRNAKGKQPAIYYPDGTSTRDKQLDIIRRIATHDKD